MKNEGCSPLTDELGPIAVFPWNSCHGSRGQRLDESGFIAAVVYLKK